VRSRLVGTVLATAAVSCCLCLGAMQLLATPPASASSSVQTPTDSELLQQIADNTSKTNADLVNVNDNLKRLVKSEGKVSLYTDTTALRLKNVNTNLVALHNQLKSIFAYRGPRTSYTFNALSDLMAGLCAIIGNLEGGGPGPVKALPPC
jgi:hypothetical protein